MAKTDSFFIRSTKDLGNTNTYHEKEIDIGAFVDPLAKSVLRILNVQVVFSDNSGRSTTITGQAGGNSAAAQYQLTTQPQSNIVLASDKSLVASGRIVANTRQAAGNVIPDAVYQDFDHAPQMFSHGYLVGVDTLYLGGAASTAWAGDQYCTVILECQSESLTKEAAVALALSQQ